jgi:hypothetical protein
MKAMCQLQYRCYTKACGLKLVHFLGSTLLNFWVVLKTQEQHQCCTMNELPLAMGQPLRHRQCALSLLLQPWVSAHGHALLH